MDSLMKAYDEDSDTCDVCALAEKKYKCPACGIRTCGLACVKSHKLAGCTGIRAKTHYISMKDYSEHDFWSDITFLEDMTRNRDNTTRVHEHLVSAVQIASHPQSLPARRKILLRQAHRRQIQLRFMPKGMSRSEQNKSFYHSRKQIVFWSLEWVFPTFNYKWIDEKVPEQLSLNDALNEGLHYHIKDLPAGLQDYIRSNDRVILIRHLTTNKSLISYHALSGERSLLQALYKKSILEFPTFIVIGSSDIGRLNLHVIEDNVTQDEIESMIHQSLKRKQRTNSSCQGDVSCTTNENSVSEDTFCQDDTEIS